MIQFPNAVFAKYLPLNLHLCLDNYIARQMHFFPRSFVQHKRTVSGHDECHSSASQTTLLSSGRGERWVIITIRM